MVRTTSIDLMTQTFTENLIQAETSITEFHTKVQVLTQELNNRETKSESCKKQEYIIQLIEESNQNLTREQTNYLDSMIENQNQTEILINNFRIKQEKLETDFQLQIVSLTQQLANKETKAESVSKLEYLTQLIEKNEEKFIREMQKTKSVDSTFKEMQSETATLIISLQTKHQKLETHLANMWKYIKQTIKLDITETKDECNRKIKLIEENAEKVHQICEKQLNNTVQEVEKIWSFLSGIESKTISKEETNIFRANESLDNRLEYEWKNSSVIKSEVGGPSRMETSDTVFNQTVSNISSWDLGVFCPLKDITTYNVLLLGGIGVGKSTFVNALCNYFTHQDVKYSKDQNVNIVTNRDFASSDPNAERLYVQLSHEDLRSEGQSSTKQCQAYEFRVKDFNIRLIDTPGLGDCGGIERDQLNLEKTIEFLSQFKTLHTICFLIKPNEIISNATFLYCVKQFFSQLHRNSINNIVFVFTNYSQSTEIQNSMRHMGEILKKIKSVPEIPFGEENIFRFENEIFEFILDERILVRLEDEKCHGFNRNWMKSAEESQRLLTYIVNDRKFTPHDIQESIGIEFIRRAIIELCLSLSKIDEIIMKKRKETFISTFDRDYLAIVIEEYENLRGKLANFSNNLAAYLKENAVVVVNNVCEEHLKKLITNENSVNKKDNQSSVQKLIEMQENYRKERRILSKAINDSKQQQYPQRSMQVEEIISEVVSTLQTSEAKAMELGNLEHICRRYLTLKSIQLT